MGITLFGTCRLDKIAGHNNLNNMLNYTHSTKEVLQLIRFLRGDLAFPEPYDKLCFRTGIVEGRAIRLTDHHRALFDDTDVFVVEICSRKLYTHGGYYLHHLCVDRRPSYVQWQQHTPHHVMQNHAVATQSNEEIESDLAEIQRLLSPRPVVVVSHYNSKRDGLPLPARNDLIRFLESACLRLGIPFIDPTVVLSGHAQGDVMTGDLGHYTPLGLKSFAAYVDAYLETMVTPLNVK